ncbi:hypothetical protein V2J09_014757 [Rumex salicifolius]
MAWRSRTLAVAMVAALVLLQVQLSTQLPYNHPLRRVVDRVNQREGPFIGLVMAFGKEELVLVDSGLFKPSSFLPSIQIAGRIFNIGKVKGVPTVYVMTGEQIANAAMTMQMLYDTFDVVGAVHYGIAGSVNPSLNVGDVVAPDYSAYSNSWHWINNGTTEENAPTLKFGKFNLPTSGDSLLGQIIFNTVEVYTNKVGNESRKTDTFWIQADPAWLSLSRDYLKDVELNTCYSNGSAEVCLTTAPKAYYGQKGSTSNVFLANVPFRDFTYRNFNFSFADEETTAVIQTSVSNNKPCVVFRGISDLGGASTANTTTSNSTLDVKYLAAYNCMKLAVEFIGLFGTDAQLIRQV